MKNDIINEKAYLKIIRATIKIYYESLIEFNYQFQKSWKEQLLQNYDGFSDWARNVIEKELKNDFGKILVKNLGFNLLNEVGMSGYISKHKQALYEKHGEATSEYFPTEARDAFSLVVKGFNQWLKKTTSTLPYIEVSSNSFYLNKFNAEFNLFARDIKECIDVYK